MSNDSNYWSTLTNGRLSRRRALFATGGLAAGAKVSLLLTGNPIRKADSTLLVEEWTATGDGKIEKVAGKSYFVAEAPGKTRVTGIWR